MKFFINFYLEFFYAQKLSFAKGDLAIRAKKLELS